LSDGIRGGSGTFFTPCNIASASKWICYSK
jgi:hypothetical protein